jgi:hypothetical protein
MLAYWFVTIQMKLSPGKIENKITLQAFSIQSSISFNKIKGKKSSGAMVNTVGGWGCCFVAQIFHPTNFITSSSPPPPSL